MWSEDLIYLCMVIAWVFGVAAAQGFWQVLFAVVFPPYSWFLIAEYILERLG